MFHSCIFSSVLVSSLSTPSIVRVSVGIITSSCVLAFLRISVKQSLSGMVSLELKLNLIVPANWSFIFRFREKFTTRGHWFHADQTLTIPLTHENILSIANYELIINILTIGTQMIQSKQIANTIVKTNQFIFNNQESETWNSK